MPETPPMRDNGPVNHADQEAPAVPVEGQTPRKTGSRLHPRVTSFRSRRGALTSAQQESWDRQWPKIGAEVSDTRLDAAAWFGRDAPLILEIGSGTGTATAAMAKAEPHVNLMAVEVYRPGLAQLLQQIERDGIPNIRVLRGDAMDVLENMVEPESLTGVRVFFPDPWPKARHHKRRLLQAPTFALIASRLKPGGVLHVATDHVEYAEAIAEAGNAEPLLTSLDWESPMTHERPVTKFEDKAHQVGSAITELIWGKIRS
ncbi:tRNA (guanosine(46)-N7)-methyltransferase TrmB [Rhodococcus sp. USK13]|uniref:tRNA (guanosine(46)-N7)-methyltransferase TrmB n=1 Tax=Rhodococcus sp. USK13 TaxID=2806442 RepID=UPI001BCF963D|nr:tRNA (guanosine(46)-N7)-methyltransferase TrmB [Rhodococcus sp. USK13]